MKPGAARSLRLLAVLLLSTGCNCGKLKLVGIHKDAGHTLMPARAKDARTVMAGAQRRNPCGFLEDFFPDLLLALRPYFFLAPERLAALKEIPARMAFC